ncbi:ABC transporter permease [Flavobacterium sp.]|uniref:ABC transporter permease n=1 Tax=Flavobacterium sp. TaxID=239 RepID=UPI0028BECBE7|nr:ABC transporter permease [Flavobacterium sp.]
MSQQNTPLLYVRLLKESLGFALNALRNNKLRTLLSLLGVTIGIFSIIAVLAAVDSMDRKIKSDLSGLDKNTVYLMKFSFAPTDIPQWKIGQFPNVKYDEFLFLKRNMSDLENIGYMYFTKRENIKYEKETASGIEVVPCTDETEKIDAVKIADGRFFSEAESNAGSSVIVIGYEVAQTLFGSLNAVGKEVRLYGQRFQVIGVMEKQGETVFGSNDTRAYFPANFVRRLYGDNTDFLTPVITLKPEKGVDMDEFKGELAQKIRSFRGMKISEPDNFFINVLSGFTDAVDNIVGQMNGIGWAISGFSLLVGGFGIANIMFVSVKERTNLIGIQKALGAKNRFILFQFLFEAIILSVIGGAVGMFLVWIIAMILTKALDFEFVLGFSNIMLGTSLAAFIGLVSGIIPAISASKLDPVEAIRSGM